MNGPIFINKEAIMPGFKLAKLRDFLCREKEVEQVTFFFKDIFQDCPMENLLIITQGGTGVSTLLDLCLRYAKSVSTKLNQKICIITVDCEKYHTDFSVFNYVRDALPYEGKKPKELRGSCHYVRAINDFIKEYDGRVIIILENAEKLDRDYAVEGFVRMGENDKDPYKVANHPFLICVARSLRFGDNFNGSLNSRYHPWTQVFYNYKRGEIRKILTERIKIAFKPDAIPPEVLDLLVTTLDENDRNMTVAMDFLLRAGEIADKRGQDKITLDIMQELIHKRYFEEEPEWEEEEMY